jgi:hypothetical protein
MFIFQLLTGNLPLRNGRETNISIGALQEKIHSGRSFFISLKNRAELADAPNRRMGGLNCFQTHLRMVGKEALSSAGA